MTMNKWLKLTAMLMALLMLAGCNLIATDPVLDAQQTVAQVGDTKITKGEWLEQTDAVLYNTQMVYNMYGMQYDITNSQYIAAAREQAIDGLIAQEVVLQKAAAEGLDVLSEEEQKQLDEDVASRMESYVESYKSAYFADTELEGEALTEAIAERMAENGISEEELRDALKKQMVAQKVYDFAIAGVEVTDEEAKAEYETQLASQQTTLEATPTLYASYVSNGTTVYFVPEGYRGIKQILIKLDSTKASEINSLQTTINTNTTALTNLQTQLDELQNPEDGAEKTATPGEVEASVATLEEQIAKNQAETADAQTKLEALKAEAYAEIQGKANEALEKAKAGEDFDALIETYNDDAGMTQEPYKTTGYPVCEGLTAYVTSFQDAAMALEKVGDVSELVESSYGYHILQYTTDIPSGPVAFEDVAETIRESLLSQKQDDTYTAKLDEWTKAMKVTKNKKLLESK